MKPYAKLALGLQYGNAQWVATSLDYLFLSGPTSMDDPDEQETREFFSSFAPAPD